MTDTETFNLLDEPWILCMDSADNRKALSIRDIFSGQGDAHKIGLRPVAWCICN